MDLYVLEIFLALLALYIAYIIQYIIINNKSVMLTENEESKEIIEFIKENYKDKTLLRTWRTSNGPMLIMAALYIPPFTPLIVLDNRFLKQNIETTKVFLAHEIGHLRRKSQIRMLIISLLSLSLVFIIGYFNEIVSVLLFPLIMLGILLFYRREEFEADKYAAKLLGIDKVLETYEKIALKSKEFEVKMPRNPIFFTIYVLRKIGVYPSIKRRIEELRKIKLHMLLQFKQIKSYFAYHI